MRPTPTRIGSTRTGSTRRASVVVAVLGAVGDPEGARTVTSIIALLVALGLGMVMLAVWLHRRTRPDPEVLAPLEVMGERKWRRRDPVWQRRRLDEIRPSGASPLEPSIAPPDIDEAFDAGPSASGFDDLHEIDLEPDQQPIDDDVSRSSSEFDAPDEGQTPRDLPRPAPDEFDGSEVDPDALAAAMAELDAEFGPDRG